MKTNSKAISIDLDKNFKKMMKSLENNSYKKSNSKRSKPKRIKSED